jgi:hypothetical protein
MLAPAVPLLFLLSADALVRLPRRFAIALASLAAAHAWCLAMVRGDALTSVTSVLTSGPRLPWLTSVWRAGGTYLPTSLGAEASPSLLALPFLVLGALLLAWIWTRRGPRPAAPTQPSRG